MKVLPLPWTFVWLGRPRKMAVPSPGQDVKEVSLISTFVLNTLTNKVHFLDLRAELWQSRQA